MGISLNIKCLKNMEFTILEMDLVLNDFHPFFLLGGMSRKWLCCWLLGHVVFAVLFLRENWSPLDSQSYIVFGGTHDVGVCLCIVSNRNEDYLYFVCVEKRGIVTGF